MLPNRMVEKIKEKKEHQTERYLYKYCEGKSAKLIGCKAYILRYDKKEKQSITVWKEPLEEQLELQVDEKEIEVVNSDSVPERKCVDEAEEQMTRMKHMLGCIEDICTMRNAGEQLNMYGQVIARSIIDVKIGFVKIGYCLYCVKRQKLYTLSNEKNIYTYAFRRFRISRGACNEYIKIVERFCKRDESDMVLPELEDQYINYSLSQLAMMQRLDDSQLEKVNATMTIREMKDLIKKDDDITKKPTKENLFKVDNKKDLFEKLDYLKDLYEDGDKLQEQNCHIEINIVYD